MRGRFSGKALLANSDVVTFITIVVTDSILVASGIHVFFESAPSAATSYKLMEPFNDVNLTRESAESPLQVACLQGHIDIVVLLLEAGADLAYNAGDYGTALQCATDKNHDAIVSLLLEAGASMPGKKVE